MPGAPRPVADLWPALLPLAAAIFAFGTIYGALQGPVAGAARTLAASALIYSGVAQFATAGLVGAGAGAGAVILTVLAVNLRHVLLGAALRQRLPEPAGRRAALAFLMIDETVGLALASTTDVRRRYLVAGIVCYSAWLTGTAAGLFAAGSLATPLVADAVFPVLFTGLAAVTAGTRPAFLRALLAVPVLLAVSWALPAAAPLAPLPAAVAVALLSTKR